MRRIIISALVFAAMLAFLPLGKANAGTYEKWIFRNGQICVQTGGSTYWPIATATAAWNASDINVTYRTNCATAGYDRKQTVLFKAYYDANDYACAKTASENNSYSWEYVYYNGVKTARWVPNAMTVWINWDTSRAAGCRANYNMRLHLISHELGHSFGLGHPEIKVNSVMPQGSWSVLKPTSWDIANANGSY